MVPNSEGSEAPKLKAPANACDCHMHIYDGERFPPARPGPQSRMQSNAAVDQYKLLQARIGTTRTVIVTPAAYVTDNRVTTRRDPASRPANTRGVAVVHPTVDRRRASPRMADAGIRGIRFTVFDPASAAVSIDMIEPLAKRVADLGWHVQIHMRGDQIVENADLLQRLPTQVVFDHMGRLPQPAPLDHPAYKVIRAMLDKGRTWMKLSGAYMDTKSGAPAYADKRAVARGVSEGRARAHGVGLGLAASDREEQAERRDAVRSARRMGAGRGIARAHSGEQSGSAVRFRENGLR